MAATGNANREARRLYPIPRFFDSWVRPGMSDPLRRFRHWKPRYIYHRLGLMVDQRRHPQAPWLTRAMVEILESWLRPDDRGIEWGSGRSTVWFAERVGSLVSVEHSPDWYRRVSVELKRKGLQNVEYHLCKDEREYCSSADKVPNESLDFCLVDGLARDCCALAAISLVKPGGIVIVDNFNRYFPTQSRSPFSRKPEEGPYTKRWADFLAEVGGWRKIWTTNGVSDTGLWIKPTGTRNVSRSVSSPEQFSLQHDL